MKQISFTADVFLDVGLDFAMVGAGKAISAGWKAAKLSSSFKSLQKVQKLGAQATNLAQRFTAGLKQGTKLSKTELKKLRCISVACWGKGGMSLSTTVSFGNQLKFYQNR